MRRTTPLRRAGIAVALPLALALTACGADDNKDSRSDSSRVEEKNDTANSEPSEQSGTGTDAPGTDGTGEAEQPADGSEPAATGEDAAPEVGDAEPGESLTPEQFADLLRAGFDKATTAGVTLETRSGTMRTGGNGVIDFTGDSPAMQIAMTSSAAAQEQELDIRLVDDAVYMNMGALSGDKFVKMDAGDASGAGLDLNQIDPSRNADQFAEAATSVTYEGVEEIGGESLHHYALLLDPRRMGVPKQQQGKLPKSFDYDVWFDGEGFVRQFSLTMGDKGSTKVTYSDWGKDVDITAPPASDVMEMPQQPKSPQG